MKLDFGEHSLELSAWESESRWQSELHRHEAGQLTLGRDTHHPEDFYIVSLTRSPHGQERFGIGIVSEGHGLVPHCCIWPDQVVAIGFNSEVVGIDARTHELSYRIELSSLFHRFISFSQGHSMHIVHGIGWLSVNSLGQELWGYSKDIVIGWQLDDRIVRLDFMDSPSISLDASSGRPISSI